MDKKDVKKDVPEENVQALDNQTAPETKKKKPDPSSSGDVTIASSGDKLTQDGSAEPDPEKSNLTEPVKKAGKTSPSNKKAATQAESGIPEPEPEKPAVDPSQDVAEYKPGNQPKTDETDDDQTGIKEVDYSRFSQDELLSTLSILVADRPVQEVRQDIELIKISFYKKLKKEIDKKQADFIKEGGNPKDFNPGIDPGEEQLKGYLNQYKKRKSDFNKQQELQKQANLEEKFAIIQSIESLINKEESINKTFQEFRELQNRWRTVGLVPQSKLKDLWENYHYHVEKFYDFIKINKELRDLDLRKNMEIKMALCEKTENLLLEENIVNAFKTLQKFHERWREIGPVPRESKDELWERFRQATSRINKRHQQHFENLKSSLRKNLEEKTKLCEEVEEILTHELNSHKDWERKSKQIIDIQKAWKTIGFAPKKHNTLIYERFRKACDAFFENKRGFYTENKEIQQNNLQLKKGLCIQAEGLQESSEWKKTTEDLIQLQKQWKEIGPVPKKYADQIWKRFRAACDTFFNRKSDYYSNIDKTYQENLDLKIKLIGEIEAYKFGDNLDENFSNLQKFQRRWSEIGFVPLKEKENISQKYRNTVNKLFDKLELDDSKKEMLKYKNKLAELSAGTGSDSKLETEREKYAIRVKKLESDIVVWENNIGFFTKSKNADPMIKDINNKIMRAKQNLKIFQDKIKMIDDFDSV